MPEMTYCLGIACNKKESCVRYNKEAVPDRKYFYRPLTLNEETNEYECIYFCKIAERIK